MGPGADVAIIYIIVKTYKSFDLSIGEVTAILLYVRTLQTNLNAITTNVQAVAKVFGASYEIGVLMASPNKIEFNGEKRPEELEDANAKLIELD